MPVPSDQFLVPAPDGAALSVRIYGQADAPRLYLSHGNGLAIDAYRVFWEPLIERFQLVMFDFRNHGQSPLAPPEARHDWDSFADDIERLLRAVEARIGPKPATGVFHSMAAVTSALHAMRYATPWQRLVLFDPSFYPRAGHPLIPRHQAHMDDLVARTLRRRDRFENPQALAASLRRNAGFSHWRDAAFDDTATALLRPDGDSYVLACPPRLEAEIYRTNSDGGLWAALPKLPIPVHLVIGDPNDPVWPVAPVCAALAAEQGIDCQVIEGTSHFLQMEEPERCREALYRVI